MESLITLLYISNNSFITAYILPFTTFFLKAVSYQTFGDVLLYPIRFHKACAQMLGKLLQTHDLENTCHFC